MFFSLVRQSHKFHHIEFYCGDSQNTAARFGWALGMQKVAVSDQSTANAHYASTVMRTNDLTIVFTCPYSTTIDRSKSVPPHSGFNQHEAHEFIKRHGLGVRAVAILVDDAVEAYNQCVANGGVSVCAPQLLRDADTTGYVQLSEVKLYGDAVMRFISKHDGYVGAFLPKYQAVQSPPFSYGIQRMDHIVGNVPSLVETVNYVARMTGFHEFAEFTTEDVGTVDSGLNSMVMGNNNEMVLMPINEPTFGTKRKSQIQTYLEQNEGAGVQHIAVKTNDIFATLREMRQRRHLGGFDFMPQPSDKYYRELPEKVGDALSADDLKQCQELGILVDKDDMVHDLLCFFFTKHFFLMSDSC
jgi:4-hydroxyphenylpyruvate dioxygenase